jgi:biotin transport system substrate-specific component
MERNIALVALFAALIAALGIIPQVTLPFGVPITAQSLGVMLCGTVLGAKRGVMAVLLFMLLVCLGLPLLSGGRGGLGVIVSPTGGFFLAFPVAAFVAGLITQSWRSVPLAVSAGVAAVIGGAVLYVFGIIGLSAVLGKSLGQSTLLVTAFIPGDLVKAVLAGLITSALYNARPRAVLSRS